MKRSGDSNRRPVFTLTELLVVMCIIAYMMTAPDEVFFHTLLIDGRYMGASGPQVFSCPARVTSGDSGMNAVFGAGKPNYYYSYGMMLDGPSEDPTKPESVGWSQFLVDDDGIPKYVVNTKKGGIPSRQPLFADSVSDSVDPLLYSAQVYSIMMGSTRWGSTSHHIHGRHGGKADAVYADGHSTPAFATDFKTFLKEDCCYAGQYRFYTDPFPFFVVVGVN